MNTGPAAPGRPLWMCAAFGLPSIFVTEHSQQTFPAFSVISTLPRLVAGAAGGILGGLGAVQIVRGALRRGGTTSGTGILVALAGVGVAALALIPVVGYVEAVGLPAFAARLRKRAPERYAGLRTLARD